MGGKILIAKENYFKSFEGVLRDYEWESSTIMYFCLGLCCGELFI